MTKNNIFCLCDTPFRGEGNEFHYLYQIINTVNNKIYIGVHSTNNLNDGYMGSGTAIKRAIKKYSLEKFQKTILFFFNTKKELYNKEAEIVNEDFIMRKDTYNLREGGTSALGRKNPRYGVKLSQEQKTKISNSLKTRYKKEPEILKRVSNTLKEYYKNNPEAKERVRERCTKNRDLANKAKRKSVLLVSCEKNTYGEKIMLFNSYKEAAQKLNIIESTVSNIVRKLNGKEYYRRLFNDNSPAVGVGWTLIDPDRYEELFPSDMIA